MTYSAAESESIRNNHGDWNKASFTTDAPISPCIDADVDRVDKSSGCAEGCVISEIISSLSSSSISLESTPPKSEWKTDDGDNPCGDGGNVPNESLSNRAISFDGTCMNIEGSFNSGSNSLPLLSPSPSSSPSQSLSTRASESESESSDSCDENRNSDGPNVDKDCASRDLSSENTRTSGVWKEIIDDFDSSRGGDRKIMRAIGRTATVNAVVAATAALGPIAAFAGYATGGAITAKRLMGDGIANEDPKEVAKSLVVFGSATSASLAGQAITGAVAIGILGVSLPLAGAMAFGVGCVSGITAGALSEWGVDGVMKGEEKGADDESKETTFRESGVTERAEKDDHGKENLPASNSIMNTKISFVDACGMWVNRQRERNRQRRIERENARQMEAFASVATASKAQEKQTPNYEFHTKLSSSSNTSCSDSGSSGGDSLD
jgi:hypothetical protein